MLILIFYKYPVRVVLYWAGEGSCSIFTKLKILLNPEKYQDLTNLIRNGEMKVERDLQLLKNLVKLANLGEIDPIKTLVPYIGN